MTDLTAPAMQGVLRWGTAPGAEVGLTRPTARAGAFSLWVRPDFAANGMADVAQGPDAITGIFGTLFEKAPDQSAAAYFNHHELPLAHTPAGEFALARYSAGTETLTLMTDPLGTRPLYYVTRAGLTAFATDIAALLPFCKAAEDLDEAAVDRFLLGPAEYGQTATLVREVRRVPPGTAMTFGPSGFQSHRYWRPEDAPRLQFDSAEDCAAQARALLVQAIEDRTPDGGTYATHLSGGLDSSMVAAVSLARRKAAGRSLPLAYAWQPPVSPNQPPTLDQEIFARCCDVFGLEGTQVNETPAHLIAFLRHDPVQVPISMELPIELDVMAHAQSRGVRLILSGWGGDQIFSHSGRRGQTPGLIPHTLRSLVRALRPGHNASGTFSKRRNAGYGRLRQFREALAIRTLRQSQLTALRSGMLQERLNSWSVHAARHGLQYSFPMLDHRLIEFALGVPTRFYFQGDLPRGLMRAAMQGWVPDDIRLHATKSEPARFAATIKTQQEVAPWCLDQLDRGAFDRSRAAFVELADLQNALRALAAGEKSSYGKITRALSLLRLTAAACESPLRNTDQKTASTG